MRRTKIVATVGPSSASEEGIRGLVDAGVDVFRLNFSHGTRPSHGEAIGRIRAAAAAAGRPVAILQDLAGPKIRTGRLRGGASFALREGDELQIVVGDFEGGPGRIATGCAELPRAVRPGGALLIDDGRIQLRVEEVAGGEIRTTVVDGGILGEFKGINVPGAELPVSGLTPKDLEDLRFGASAGVDFVALSFVQRGDDVRGLRAALRELGSEAAVVAKLERPEAVDRLDEILGESDAVMVARGDLGLELPFERVPRVQKEICRRARARGVPVIVATQVLESMRHEPRPTRAEVSDAAGAVDDGVDAIMLAGETAAGAYPVRAVRVLDAIIQEAELVPPIGGVPLESGPLAAGHGHALGEAAVTLARRARAATIVAVTRGGTTARLLSALRPEVPIVALTDRVEIARRLCLWRGTRPLVADLGGDTSQAEARIGETLVARGVLARGAVVVVVRIRLEIRHGPSNFVALQRL